ncbi:hypothetical protein Tco_0160681 [Tanacetum coccineum]
MSTISKNMSWITRNVKESLNGVNLKTNVKTAIGGSPNSACFGRGMEGFNPPPAPSDNFNFIYTDEPAQEVGEVSQRAPRKRVWQAAFDDSREMRLVDKHSLACDERIQEIIDRAKALYANKDLDIQIKEEAAIERGVQSFFADIYKFDDHRKHMSHLNRVFSAIGNKKNPLWRQIKKQIEN